MKVNKSLASIILESGGRMRYYAPKTRNARFLTAGDIEAPLRSMYKQDGIMNEAPQGKPCGIFLTFTLQLYCKTAQAALPHVASGSFPDYGPVS